ncbi:hypothetical protein BASA60_007389 [Batrachochytrium salamandrivorans]|nr:hypothetical protein BASA60_007389 [Batrachochytrium salamandrivorans]
MAEKQPPLTAAQGGPGMMITNKNNNNNDDIAGAASTDATSNSTGSILSTALPSEPLTAATQDHLPVSLADSDAAFSAVVATTLLLLLLLLLQLRGLPPVLS